MMLLYNYIIQKVKQVSCAVLLVRWLLGLLNKETECSEKTLRDSVKVICETIGTSDDITASPATEKNCQVLNLLT